MSYKTTPIRDFTRSSQNTPILLTKEKVFGMFQNFGDFHQWETATVLEVIYDNDHNDVTDKTVNYIETALLGSSQRLTTKGSDGKHSPSDIDYSWIGRIKVRLTNSEKSIMDFIYAIPMEQNLCELPLIGEVVLIAKLFNNYYYTRAINIRNHGISNVDPRFETRAGTYDDGKTFEYSSNVPGDSGPGSSGVSQDSVFLDGDMNDLFPPTTRLGAYFIFNKNIRHIKHFEGDRVFESRCGSSIRMGVYGTNFHKRGQSEPVTDSRIDVGYGQDFDQGRGNPQIIIRNRQRQIDLGTEENKFNYRIVEDINLDGNSIYLTSGRTISFIKKAPLKPLWQDITQRYYDQPGFDPIKATGYRYPLQQYDQKYDDQKYMIGQQLVMNSDRVLIQARKNEMFLFSKNRFQVNTDDECVFDVHKQFVMNTNTKIVLNSPFIYLGQYNQSREPVLLGQTTIDWLWDLCKWLEAHIHWHPHHHKDPTEREVELWTSVPKQIPELQYLEQLLPTLCSDRVFVAGGGYAPGVDGGIVPYLAPPTSTAATPGGYWVAEVGQYGGTILSQPRNIDYSSSIAPTPGSTAPNIVEEDGFAEDAAAAAGAGTTGQ